MAPKRATAKKKNSLNPLDITSVAFRANIELKPYSHAHLEATAAVAPNQDPKERLDQLKAWVAFQLKATKQGNPEVVARGGRFLDALTTS